MLLHRKNSLKMFVCECFDLMRPEQKTNPYPQMLYFILPDLLQAMQQSLKLWRSFHKRLLSNILQSFPCLLRVNVSKAKNAISGRNFPKLMAR